MYAENAFSLGRVTAFLGCFGFTGDASFAIFAGFDKGAAELALCAFASLARAASASYLSLVSRCCLNCHTPFLPLFC